jgi:acyl carrier protein
MNYFEEIKILMNKYAENREIQGEVALSEYINSLNFINLIVDIEEKFDVKIADEDLMSPSFESVQAIANFLSIHAPTFCG